MRNLSACLILSASLLGLSLPALADTSVRLPALQQLLGSEQPISGGIDINLPLVAEDGGAVPLRLSFTDRLNPGEQITAIRVFAARNPRAEVIEFAPAASLPRLEFSTRIRLNESQTVYVLASSSDGRHWLASRDVRVTVSGCLVRGDDTEAEVGMSQPRIALPRNARAGQAGEVRTLLNHPMETGLREDGQGGLVAENLVSSLTVTDSSDTTLLQVQFHSGTAANPFVTFFLDQFEGLTFTWQDQQGRTLTESR